MEVSAQSTVKFHHLGSLEDGLSHPSVTAILKDQHGFMWFGTRDGLNKYDSYSFRQFKLETGDSTSISNSTISSLYEDHLGIIWVGTDGGLNSYDPATDQFERHLHDPDNPQSIPDNAILAVIGDAKGNLWVSTRAGGLSSYDRKTDTFKHYLNSGEESNGGDRSIVMSAHIDAEGIIWMPTEGTGLIKFDPAINQAEYFRHDPDDSTTIGSDIVNSIFEDDQGILWIGSWGFGLNRLDKKTKKFKRYIGHPDRPEGLPSNNIFAICQENQGLIWLGTRNGLSLFDPIAETFTTYANIPGNSFSFNDNVGYSMFYDKTDEMLWVGTWGNGIDILNRQGRQVLHFNKNPEDANSLNDNDVFALFEDPQGIVWIGTEGGGLNRYDPATDSYKAYVHDPNDPASISSDEVMCIHQDRHGQFWIGTFGGGLNKFDPATGIFERFDGGPKKSFDKRNILSIYEDSKGFLWLTTVQEEVIRIDPSTDEYTYYQDPDHINKDMFNDVLTIIEDRTGAIWFGTRNSGMARLDQQTGTFTYFEHNLEDSLGLGANGIYVFHEDKKGNLWIGTRGSGLNILELPIVDKPVFTKITTQQGLVSDWILGIEEDAHGNIWASGDGISKIVPDTREVSSFYFAESNQGAFHKSLKTGKFFMGVDGVDVFHPDSIKENTGGAPILISHLNRYNDQEQSGIPIPVPGIYAQDSITLSYRDQILAFEFLSLEYDTRKQRQYAYYLENFNNDWIQMGSERKITFTGLAAGTYPLRVKTISPTGELGQEEANLVLIIHPPWWQSNWAWIIYILAGLSSLYGIYYWRRREDKKSIQLKEKELQKERELNDRLQQIDKLKDHFLANTSHELRTPLQGIIGLSESLMERIPEPSQKEDLDMIISSGKRLNNLINDILDFSKLRNKELSLYLKPVDMRAATNIVLTLSKPLLKGKSVNLINAIPIGTPLVHADENRIQQILHNLIGNALKFTENGSIEVSCKEDEGMLSIAVKDSGIGIPKDKLDVIFNSFEQLEDSLTREHGGTGLGLTVTKQLVRLHGGTITVVSEPNKGSTFEFTLPLSTDQKAALKEDSREQQESIIISSLDDNTAATAEVTKVTETNGEDKIEILIVDDEPVNLKVLDNHLSLAGYSVTQASDGIQALEILGNGKKYDLVILDIMMPKMSGFQVCQELRSTYLSSQLPVVMLTAKNRVTDLVEGFNAGANDYLTKPFTKDELLSRIKTHLNLHRINRATAKFVPHEFLKALGRDSITEIRLGDHVERNVTVFFSDIREYTTLAEHMTPEENFKFINSYVGKMGPIIKANNGFVNQYLGDGIMAIFSESFEDALKASIGMLRKIQEYNKERIDRQRRPIAVGMGLHLGPLVMGIIGDVERIEPSLIADTVNAASRMEGLTKYYGANLVISEDCFEALTDKHLYHFRYLGKVQVKGKQQTMGAYECIDGDEQEVKLGKIETMTLYVEGLEVFYGKEFSEATAIFGKILKLNPKDKVAEFFRDRAARFTYEGIPDDWTGVDRLDRK